MSDTIIMGIENRNSLFWERETEMKTIFLESRSSDSILEKKCALRRAVANLRKEYAHAILTGMSRQITERILTLEDYKTAKTVFLYMDLPGEVQTRELILQCLKDGKRVAVPGIVSVNDNHKQGMNDNDAEPCFADEKEMRFYEIKDFDHLVRGAMNILEPDPASSSCLDGEEDALVIMPGVAFDRNRNRIGYGGGFYDRYLQSHRNHPTIAAAYDFQVFDEVPHTKTDIRPRRLVTPSRCL